MENTAITKTAPATAPAVLDIQSAISAPAGIFNPAVVAAIVPVAQMMAKSGQAVPEWLRENEGGCFAICADAARWGVNPWGLARDSFCVNGGTPSYGGKATHAIIQRQVGDLEHEYIGDWSKVQGKVVEKTSQKGTKYYAPAWNRADEDGLGIEVWRGNKRLTLTLTQCTVRNSTNWATNPQLQLYYQACKVWGRMYAPAALLGFYTTDEMPDVETADPINVTPESAPRSGKVAALKERLGVTPAAELPPPGKTRSAMIAEILERAKAPVVFADVEKYLKAPGVGEIDNAETWSDRAMLLRFDADPEKAVKAVANALADGNMV